MAKNSRLLPGSVGVAWLIIVIPLEYTYLHVTMSKSSRHLLLAMQGTHMDLNLAAPALNAGCLFPQHVLLSADRMPAYHELVLQCHIARLLAGSKSDNTC